MIALSKASRLNWLAYNTPQLFFFTAGTKKPLSDIAQRAVWASSIITLIKDANKFHQPYKSLSTLIEQLRIPSERYDFGQDFEKEVKGMFLKGIKLRPEFKVQQRIRSGSHQRLGFVFHPNYTVTQPIFECLTNFSKNYFITGGYGISKTVSFALYQQLSPYIHKFVFQSLSNSSLAAELLDLEQASLLTRYPKCWYWSMGHKTFSQSKLMDYIIEQTIELPEDEKAKLKQARSEEQLQAMLMKTYDNAQIQRFVIVDQINLAASLIRNWNNYLDLKNSQIRKLDQKTKEVKDKYKATGKRRMTNEIKKNMLKELSVIQNQREFWHQNPYKSKQFTLAIDIIEQIQRFRRFGVLQIFASSVNFERDILINRPQESSLKLGLHLNKNQKTVYERHINFSKAIKQFIGKADFIDFFVFEMKRRIAFSTKVPKEAFDKWESAFRTKATNMTFKGYYRIIFIRQYLFDKITLILDKMTQQSFILAHKSNEKTKICKVCEFELQEGTSPQILKFYAVGLKEDRQMDLFESFEAYCREQSLNKMKKFLQTQNKKKFAILQVLYRHAENAKKFNYTSFDFHTQTYNKILNCNAQQLFLDNLHNKELLPIEYNDKIITLHWTPEEFMQLAEKFVKAKLLQFYDIYLNGYFALYFQRSKIGLGSIFQFAVMQLLNPNISVQFHFKNEQGGLTPKNFEILDTQIFVSFYKPNDSSKKHYQASYNIKENLSQVMKLAEENQGKSIAGEPHVRTFKSLQFDQQSPTIDFVIVRYSQKKHEIFTFDVATSKKQKNIKEKMDAAVTFFTDLTQDPSFEKEKYIIQHVILCKQDLCLPKTNKPNFSITCSPYELLDASNFAQEYLHKYLYFNAFRKAVVDKNFDLEDPALINGRLSFAPSKK